MTRTVKVNESVNANVKRILEVDTSAIDDDDTTIVHTSNTVADLTALGEANLVNIGTSATGTEIATAVNGILAILLAAGLMVAAG